MVCLQILCVVFVFNARSAISFPVDAYQFQDYEADHDAAVAEIDGHLLSMPYIDEAAADFEKEAGNNYNDGRYSLAGAKGDRGYNKFDGFQNGRVGHYGAQGQKVNYNDKAGRKSGHADNSNYYKNNNAVRKAAQGGDFAVSNSFNKGSKTAGFHNVHHKEEYKKNQKFYNEGNNSGYYRRYGDFGAALLAAQGNSAKGNRYDQGYADANYGKSGFANQGSLYNDLKKYAGANGYDGNYGNYGDYGQNGGGAYGQTYGY